MAIVSSTLGSPDVDNLEAALQRGILLDVFAILIQRGCANSPQFAAGQRRLQHVARVNRAFGRARAHERVQFVDEQNDSAHSTLRFPSAPP